MRATRVITIRAAADHVWPWIAQLGQGRGGFYSYDLLENLVGCNIHSSSRVLLEWQDVEVGDEIRLAPQVGLVVAFVEQGRSLVLRGGIPMGKRAQAGIAAGPGTSSGADSLGAGGFGP